MQTVQEVCSITFYLQEKKNNNLVSRLFLLMLMHTFHAIRILSGKAFTVFIGHRSSTWFRVKLWVALYHFKCLSRLAELQELRVFKVNFHLCAKRFHSAYIPNHIQPVKQEKHVCIKVEYNVIFRWDAMHNLGLHSLSIYKVHSINYFCPLM